MEGKMKTYRLKYGSRAVRLRLPEENVLNIVEVKDPGIKESNGALIQEALEQPVNAPLLKEVVAGKKVALLVEDATREVPVADIFPPVAEQLSSAAFVQVLVCTGTHNPTLPGNREIVDTLQAAFRQQGVKKYDIEVHRGKGIEYWDAGEISTGNRILVNPRAKEVDVYLALSDMKNHYFAGYSNALKNFLPGICANETTERNHALALREESTFGHHPLHSDPRRRDNPLAQEMLEAFRLIRRDKVALTLAVISKGEQVLWAEFGELEEVVRRGTAEVDRLMSQTVEAADLLIVSPGGFPNDESLYTAQRALELSKRAVKPGGEVLFVAECRHGIGPDSAKENFYDLLSRPLEEVFKILERKYILYSHKAYKFARMIANLKRIGFYTRLDRSLVEPIHLYPVESPQQFVEEALKRNPNLTINIVNDGNKIALHSRSDGRV